MSRSFRAIFARGGTSNGLVIQRQHLPPENQWPFILPAAMGSPDPHLRQLNGMGSGVSSTSKICIISPSIRADADVDYTFVQVGIADGKLDTAGNCGNMSSVIGPIGLNERLLKTPILSRDKTTATVRIFNTNTSKVIHSHFRITPSNDPVYEPQGDISISGVPGTGSLIALSFLQPAGSATGRGALPTGKPIDVLKLPNGHTVSASLIDVSNPAVICRGADLLDISTPPKPAEIETDLILKDRLELIRRAGATAMGLDPDIQSVPKIVVVWPSKDANSEEDLRCVAMSMGQAHRAVPLTMALCLGSAAGLEGTIPHELVRKRTEDGQSRTVIIEHPSGTLDVGVSVENGKIVSAELRRTARILMKGEVYY